MGKIVMPKNSALLNEIEAVLQIYYEADDWITNSIYKDRLKAMIGEDQYQSSYTKKAQITSYFGFTIWEDINNPQSKRRITPSGIRMYNAIKSEDEEAIQSILMDSLERVTFGRNNYGCPESDSDVEPPSLFIRAILDLHYLTYKEFAFLLWKLEDEGDTYTDAMKELMYHRDNDNLTLNDEATKYTDAKPIMVLVRWGFLAEETGDSGGKHIVINPKVLSRFRIRLKNLKIYNIDMDIYDSPIANAHNRNTGGFNIILYGVPGAGKSYTIEKDYCSDENYIERLVFHPDYTYSDFVGQILPVVDEQSNVSYVFSPGPFTSLLKKAYDNPSNSYFLIIEEINRGNAPAIFGDIFQLLDRAEDGTSEYGVTNSDISQVVFGNNSTKIRIPSNMSLIATMNTSDQNVFTLDTAFQRRWNMRMIDNDFSKVDAKFAKHKILDTSVTWQKFCTEINRIILSKSVRVASAEDKRLGAYFVKISDLIHNTPVSEKTEDKSTSLYLNRNGYFSEKVLKYLWDDAFKFSREDIFDVQEFMSLEEVINKFKDSEGDDRFHVFKEEVFLLLTTSSTED